MTEKTRESIQKALKTGKSLNLNLEPHGKVKIERRLPFLLIYRNPDPDNKKILRLVLGESSYLVTNTEKDSNDKMAEIIKLISKTLSEEYRAVMIIEIWIGDAECNTFKIKTSKEKAPATVDSLYEGLVDFCSHQHDLKAEIEYTPNRHPEDLPPLLTLDQCQEAGAYLVGLEIPPFFEDEEKDEFYYMVFRDFKTQFSKILRKSIYEFIRVQTTFDIRNYQVLGSTVIGPSVWDVDKQLYKIQENFQFLLLISPINTMDAKAEFIEKSYRTNPKFLYRLLPIDPDQLKEELFKINIRSIEDPTLAILFSDKREELEKQITMLKERGTSNFMFSSIRLYSSVDKDLYETARYLLKEIPPEDFSNSRWVEADELADRCREEVKFYQKHYPRLDAKVEVKNDIVGMLVSKGQLYIGKSFKVPEERVEALVHHEIGTHVLTFYNGMAQPFKQLSIGFAGYEELQEGIAVLAEYLVGGLTGDRLRLLAARVVAGHCLTEGSTFEETFMELTQQYNLDKESAFQVTARIHQGGGCTKDIIYLRGLIKLIDYLKDGGELEPLFIGKIALKHIPLIEELRMRKILKPAPMTPRFFLNENSLERLEKIKDGLSLIDMIK
ncbi:flavohemoglobin expression-modulating QEGLA motif protein [Litoribacter populi]|uniref:flavohemoglobin expression-modulating QEGLA motif protein n=1 Tax=Litoribacter populi TaxID=2598460 RepID=UPI001180C294|nr:tyrosine/phenylalanine carboxypeptidase domain-containing protein [Litoribacter populi]